MSEPQCTQWDCSHRRDRTGHCRHTMCSNSRNGCPVHAREGVER